MKENGPEGLRRLPDSMSTAFQEYRLRVSRNYIHFLIIAACVINLLLFIPDMVFMGDAGRRSAVIVVRAVYSLLLFILGCNIKKISTFRPFSIVVTVYEIAAYAIFMFVLFQYSNPSFTIQAMGLITLVILTFFIPNQWINMLIAATLGAAGFFLSMAFMSWAVDTTHFFAVVSYVIFAILLCAISAKSAERHQFREFVARSELEHMSSTDYLTEAANRYKMEEEAVRWMDFCRRNGLPLSLVFIDVDNLKSINDQYGHPAGDIVLSSLTKLIKNQLRSSDTLARWGGDEFVTLLPNVSLLDAVNLTERIRKAVRENVFVNGISVTCSFGVAEMNAGSDFEDLLYRADKLMYKSKTQGKDLVLYDN